MHCVGHVLVQRFDWILLSPLLSLCSQPPSFLPSILDPLLRICCDSKVHTVCGSAVEALPSHLWSSCIVTIPLLTNLPVVQWWTSAGSGQTFVMIMVRGSFNWGFCCTMSRLCRSLAPPPRLPDHTLSSDSTTNPCPSTTNGHARRLQCPPMPTASPTLAHTRTKTTAAPIKGETVPHVNATRSHRARRTRYGRAPQRQLRYTPMSRSRTALARHHPAKQWRGTIALSWV